MKLTQKGQVTIPVEIREKYGFLPHMGLLFKEEYGRVHLEKDLSISIENNPFGLVKGSADIGLTTEEIMDLTRGAG